MKQARPGSDAKLYSREVASVCLNCTYTHCVNPDYGCKLFKMSWRQAAPRNGHRGRRSKLKEA